MQQPEMQERQEPEMRQFKQVGDRVEGVLLSIDKVTVQKKPTIQYLCAGSEGGRFTFLATYDIGRKLHRGDVGRFIRIEYLGEDAQVQTQGNKLRRFRVEVSKESVTDDFLLITDEDIPF